MEGRNMVLDGLRSDNTITGLSISLTIKEDPKIKEIEKAARERKIKVVYVSPREIESQTESGNAQGVMATMRLPERPSLQAILKSKRDPLIVCFNHLDYEQNLGAALRSCWAAGVDVVVVGSRGVHEITPVVAKVSMGAAAYVPLISMSIFQAISVIRKSGIKIVGVEVGMGKAYTHSNLKGGLALVFGGEAAGLSVPLIKACDEMINIPMVKEVASINVSVATAVVLFEKNRQDRS